MFQTEERTLIRRTLAGDEGAFERLYRTHVSRAYAVVADHTRNREDVEDLVQVTFMNAFMGLKRFRGEAAFSTWLTRIAINVSRTHLQAERARRAWLETAEYAGLGLWEGQDEGPEEALYQKECQNLLIQSVQGLPAPYRQAMALRYVENRSYREIEQRLRVPMGTVKTWLCRGRRQLQGSFGS